jgi:hypothetical protein
VSAWDPHLVRPEDLGPDLAGAGLDRLVPAFLRWQLGRWPRLAEAVAALDRVRTRPFTVGGEEVVLQWNPARATSSTAKVDPASIAKRPCFLCAGNLPPEEGGLAFGTPLGSAGSDPAEWVVLPNPAPILRDHLVLAHRDHRPQDVRDSVGGLLDFALATGGAMTTLYNGPRCGASAPDHLHIQAVAAGQLPEERRCWDALARDQLPGDRVARVDGADVWTHRPRAEAGSDPAAERLVLGFAGPRDPVERLLREAIDALGADRGTDEPMVNVLAGARGGRVMALLFPRGAHRPACFFAEGPEQRIVSPGVMDVAGVVVTVRESDFEALDGDAIAGIWREVTLPPERSRDWIGALSRRWADG